jgi:hypothetical protein
LRAQSSASQKSVRICSTSCSRTEDRLPHEWRGYGVVQRLPEAHWSGVSWRAPVRQSGILRGIDHWDPGALLDGETGLLPQRRLRMQPSAVGVSRCRYSRVYFFARRVTWNVNDGVWSNLQRVAPLRAPGSH